MFMGKVLTPAFRHNLSFKSLLEQTVFLFFRIFCHKEKMGR